LTYTDEIFGMRKAGHLGEQLAPPCITWSRPATC
jgi:hypothetical protein